MNRVSGNRFLWPMVTDRRSRGAVLVVGLIFLVLLMLIGVTAYNVATQEERQSGNMRDRVRALAAAETALRYCESLLTNVVAPTFTTAGTNGYYISSEGSQEVWMQPGFSWTASPTVTVPSTTLNVTTVGLAQSPRCVMERLDGAPVAPAGYSQRAELPQTLGTVYRITARGVGMTVNTTSLVQSYYIRD